VTYKKFSKDNLPAAFSSATEELEDKRLARMVRAGEPFNPADLTTNVSLQPPAGMNMVTLPIGATEAAAGFCVPGSRVDVLASVQMNSMGGRAIIFPMLVDMLVLAVDTQTTGPQQGGAVGNLGSVSFAVTNAQAQIVHAAKTRGAQLRLVLRNPEKPSDWKYIPTEKEVWGIMADDPKRAFSQDGREVTEEPKDTKLKLPVPKEDLPAGTRLTEEVLKDKFTTIEFTPPAPANILADPADLKDQYLLTGLAANQFVPKSYVGAKPHQKAAPSDDDAPRSKEEPQQTAQGPKPAAPKAIAKDAPVYHDVTIQTTSGITTVRYQKLADGEFKYVGVVPTGGSKPADKKPDGDAAADEDDAPAKKPAAPKKPAAKGQDEDDAPEKKPAGK
jgi:Flp pilus assembly protein CpaB